MRSVGETSRSRFLSRSAGACPPRAFKHRFFFVARGPVPRERWITRAMARDRLPPYDERAGFSPTVARGPVPRDCWSARTIRPPSVVRECLLPNGSRAGALALQRGGGLVHERWRGTGPRPTVRGDVFHRSAGACPPRALGCARHGEGQALALR